MTEDEAAKWLEAQGFRIRRFGRQINAAYGDPVLNEDGISLVGRVLAQITPEQDGSWRLWDHGGEVQRFEEFDRAVHALREYLIAKCERLARDS